MVKITKSQQCTLSGIHRRTVVSHLPYVSSPCRAAAAFCRCCCRTFCRCLLSCLDLFDPQACLHYLIVVSFTNNCRFTLSLCVIPLLRCCCLLQFVIVLRSVVAQSRVLIFRPAHLCIIILLCGVVWPRGQPFTWALMSVPYPYEHADAVGHSSQIISSAQRPHLRL